MIVPTTSYPLSNTDSQAIWLENILFKNSRYLTFLGVIILFVLFRSNSWDNFSLFDVTKKTYIWSYHVIYETIGKVDRSRVINLGFRSCLIFICVMGRDDLRPCASYMSNTTNTLVNHYNHKNTIESLHVRDCLDSQRRRPINFVIFTDWPVIGGKPPR